MTVFRSDLARYTSSGAISQQYTNTDFREKPDPSLHRPLGESRIVYNGINVTIFADPIEITITQCRSVFSSWAAASRNPDLDQTFYCEDWDAIPEITINLGGTWLNETVFADPIEISVSPEGNYVSGVLVDSDPINIAISIHSYGAIVEMIKNSWLKWSDIGHLDFTINETNVASERPLDWRGWIYAIKKLGNRVIAYGENGVSALIPSGNAYGLNTIYRIGLKSKQAIAGDESTHYFIDNKGQLWSLGEDLTKLDYSEYLSALGSPVLSWDAANNLLYICDGTLGFIYSVDSRSLGKGPVNVTGIDSQSGNLYVTSPAAVVTPVFEICTDIYDLGSREGKIITEIQIGTNTTKIISIAVDHRSDKAGAFVQTGWHTVDANGKVFFPVYGHEFRFRLKSSAYEYFELDYLTVNGNINVVGERPLDWKEIYAVKRLGGRVVVYGDNGINVMSDGSVSEIYSIQLKSKNAVAGNESVHYFIDIEGQMWSLSDSLSKLDYSEYLSLLSSSVVMSYDFENNVIYICDGSLGYIYSPDSESLGAGSVNVTGIGSQAGNLYVVSPATITIPAFEICMDTYDMGSRKMKNIHSVEVAIDLSEHLQLQIDYRVSNREEFKSSPWFLVNPDGIAYSPCYGVEFRFRFRSFILEWFKIDRLKINGSIHGFSHRDYLAMTRQSL